MKDIFLLKPKLLLLGLLLFGFSAQSQQLASLQQDAPEQELLKKPTSEKIMAQASAVPWLTKDLQLSTEANTVEKTITGTVTDGDTGDGLPGVNVLVKGSNTGTVTDVSGNYRLSVPDDATTLIFSSVGYSSQEIQINGRSVINVDMQPDVQALSEVVVVGYGTQQKSDLTGAVASVRGGS